MNDGDFFGTILPAALLLQTRTIGHVSSFELFNS